MAAYEAAIKVLLDAKAAFAAIKEIEGRLGGLKTKAQSVQVQETVKEAAKEVTAKERALAKQIDLNAATDLYYRRLQQINRAGGARNDKQKKELAGLQEIVDTQGDSLMLVRKSATALGRILEVIRETNRADKRSNELQSQIRAYEKQFEALRKVGVTEGKLSEVVQLRDKLSDQQAKKQLDLAAITKGQLDRKLKILQAEQDNKRAVEQTAAAEKKKAQQQGLGLRALAKRFNPLIERTAQLAAPQRQLALPSTEILAPSTKGIQRLKTAETSAERTGRFAARIAQAYDRSAERARDILEANQDAVKAGKRNAREAERAAKANERSQKAVRATARTRNRAPVGRGGGGGGGGGGKSGAIAGSVGFPLLFGGGPGSIVGGGIGAAIGGFPGGILGSALGQQLDQVTIKLIEFATSLSSATIALDDLISSAGLRGTPTAANIRFSELLGAPELGRAAGKQQVEAIIGKEGVQNLQDLSDKTKQLGNVFADLSLRAGSFFAPFVSGVLGALGVKSTEETKGKNEGRAEQLRETIAKLEQDGVNPAAITVYREQLKQIEATLDGVNKKTEINNNLNNELNSIVNARIGLAEASASFEENRLGLRRDDLAVQQAGLEVTRAKNDLDELNLRLTKEMPPEKRKELELERDITDQRLRQLEAARDNARILAETQLEKEKLALDNQALGVLKRRRDLAFDFVKLTTSQQNILKARYALTTKQTKEEEKIIENQRESDLKLVNEAEKIKKINYLANEKLLLIKEEKRNKDEITRQNEVLRLDAKQAFEDQLALARLARENQTYSQTLKTDPERAFSFSGEGLGFFAQSSLFESNRIAESAMQLEEYNEAIAKLQTRITGLRDKKVKEIELVPLERELERLTQLRDDFQKFQPVLDQNAVLAARYADALNAVTPAVNSLVGGLQEVVAGTKSAQEAFADFLRTIADQLVQTAATMIAQYAALGIAKAFAFGSSSGFSFSGGSASSGLSAANLMGGAGPLNAGMFGFGRANGGAVSPGSTYLVGERGPELLTMGPSGGYVTSNSASQAAMDRYSSGNSRGGSISVNYNVTDINGMRFVTEDQFREGVAQAAKQGADGGFNRTMSSLKNSRSTRSRVGV